MSPLFSSHKAPKQIYTDSELKQLSDNDLYWRGKLIRDVFMYIAIFLASMLALGLVYEYASDASFRNFIIDQVKNSFQGIIFFILALLGLNKLVDTKK